MKMIDLNLKPDRRTLFQFGFIALAAFGLLGGLILWKKEIFGIHLGDASRTTAFILWGVGALAGLMSLVRPTLNRFLFVGLIVITFPIGFVLSYVLMGFIFYLVITPVGLFFRLIGRDALERRIDPAAKSYWSDHKMPANVERYFSSIDPGRFGRHELRRIQMTRDTKPEGRGADFQNQAAESRRGFLNEFWSFLRHNKKWWMLPMLVVIMVMGTLVLLGGTPLAPFIYTLF